jgi:membrane protein implicated in regulation of membrane protease activity
MSISTFVKGLLMSIISAAIVYFNTVPVDYLFMGLAVVSTILVYFGKNLILVLDSTSAAGTLSFVSILSGVLLALGTGLLDAGATFLIGGTILWGVVGKLTLSILFTYISTTWLSPPKSTSKKLFA